MRTYLAILLSIAAAVSTYAVDDIEPGNGLVFGYSPQDTVALWAIHNKKLPPLVWDDTYKIWYSREDNYGVTWDVTPFFMYRDDPNNLFLGNWYKSLFLTTDEECFKLLDTVHAHMKSLYGVTPMVYGLSDYQARKIPPAKGSEVRFVYQFKTTQIFIKIARLEEAKFHFVLSRQLNAYIDFVTEHLAKRKTTNE